MMDEVVTTGAIYKTCTVQVKSSPPTNQHPASYRPDALPVAQPTATEYLTKKYHIPWTCSSQAHPHLPTVSLTIRGSRQP